MGDVSRASLAVDLAGEVMSSVLESTGKAVAAGATAVLGDGNQAGGEGRPSGRHFLEPSFEHALDERGVFRNTHGQARPAEKVRTRGTIG